MQSGVRVFGRAKTNYIIAKHAAGLMCRSLVAGRGLQVIVSLIQKVSLTFIKANLRPKNFCLGLIRPKVSF